ncbi:hypothetical protein ACP6PL_06050 [Dapis sp. BLCC M126]|uniref:hypothetical protein n=1 Tax=Dapis sp. BLCC M126 TaxID=3400189 RepID=UPI003CF54743
MSENNEHNPLDDIEFTPDLIRGVKKDVSEYDNYPDNSEQVETEEEYEQINQVLQVETETKNYQELSQEISSLREKLEQFSQDVESNYSHLQEEVSRLSNFMLELQDEKLNGDVDLESFFGRVNSLENHLQILSKQIEKRINNNVNSQQQVNKKLEQLAADTKQEIEEIVGMVVDVESKQVDARKLSQDISLLKGKLKEFSNVESNSSQLQEKVAQLSSQILELQKEKSNIGVGLEPLFRRVKSLENSLQNLSEHIEERINNNVNSQQQVNEQFSQFADSQEISQEISLLREKFERFSQDVVGKYFQLHKKLSKLSSAFHLEREKISQDVYLDSFFRRVESLENHLQNMEVKYSKLQEKVKNNLNPFQEWKELFYISIWSLGLAIIPSIVNLSMDNPNIFLSLLCLILALPFLLTSLVIFFWSYFSMVLMFGQLFYSSSNLVLSKVDYWLSRYRLITLIQVFEQKDKEVDKTSGLKAFCLLFYLLFSLLLMFGSTIVLPGLVLSCSENQAGWILCFLNAAHKDPKIVIMSFPNITVLWLVICWLILQFIKALALLKQKFL